MIPSTQTLAVSIIVTAIATWGNPCLRMSSAWNGGWQRSSRLMWQDEVGVLQTLTAHREIMDRLITEYGGRIANTAGDSVLAEFPSAVEAVQCAVEVQKALADLNTGGDPEHALRFRIGVHVGDVMVRGGDLLGDGVNIAARIESLAEPGGV